MDNNKRSDDSNQYRWDEAEKILMGGEMLDQPETSARDPLIDSSARTYETRAGADYPKLMPLVERVGLEYAQARRMMHRAHLLDELGMLLAKNPEVARILELMRELNIR